VVQGGLGKPEEVGGGVFELGRARATCG
jgi:hypothetical protein